MAKKRGVGIAAVNYPTGMNLGGDPSQALIHATTTGNFVISLSSTDLGQGLKTVIAQIGAETLGVPFETVLIDTADTDTGPHCMGTFASRATHRVGNAVMQAVQEARKVMLEVAADELEASADDLETDGEGRIRVKGSPDRAVSVVDVALAAHFKYGRTISGRGIFMKPKSPVDPDTGKMDPDSTEAHACTVAEVEVDTETGKVRVIDYVAAVDCGVAVNPKLAEGQVEGAVMNGMSYALSEDMIFDDRGRMLNPSFFDYKIFTTADAPPVRTILVETYEPSGPFGAKSIAEIGINGPLPAIASAIYDACGIRMKKAPFTPERMLAALMAKK